MSLARLGGVALDARRMNQTADAAELALAAGWVAGNVLAARGVRVRHEGEAPTDARVIGVRTNDLGGLLAALSTAPALVDPETIPLRWRMALRALGVPLLDRPVIRVLDEGGSVAMVVPGRRLRPAGASCTLVVGADADGYRVRIPPYRRPMLTA